MRQFIYIVLILLLLSCSNKASKKHYESDTVIEISERFSTATSSTYKYKNIATQKLQDYFELLKLREQYPDLSSDISKQLQSLSKTSIISIDTKHTIENIQQVGEIKLLPDSIQKIKLKFSLLSNTQYKQDSINAYIKTASVVLDGRKNTSHKITFSKE